jgi:hypothetical protein
MTDFVRTIQEFNEFLRVTRPFLDDLLGDESPADRPSVNWLREGF